MKISTISRPRMGFAASHEWIDINGTVGFIGVSAHRLLHIDNIVDIKWSSIKGVITKGMLIAEIYTADQVIPVHAPLDCKFLGRNPKLAGNLNLVIESPHDKGWVLFVSPLKFGSQNPLLSLESYEKLMRNNTVN